MPMPLTYVMTANKLYDLNTGKHMHEISISRYMLARKFRLYGNKFSVFLLYYEKKCYKAFKLYYFHDIICMNESPIFCGAEFGEENKRGEKYNSEKKCEKT